LQIAAAGQGGYARQFFDQPTEPAMKRSPPSAVFHAAAPPCGAGHSRIVLLAALAVGLFAAAAVVLALRHGSGGEDGAWTATWGTGLAGPALPAEQVLLRGQTLRLIVHTSIGGSRARIRLSNEFGAEPLRIAAANLALRQAGAAIVPGSSRELRFGGRREIAIPAGGSVQSDRVELAVPALADLAVSLYLPEQVAAGTVQAAAYQMSYVSAPGDFAGAASLPVERQIPSWPFLAEVDVEARAVPGASGGSAPSAALVVFGDSIASGAVTTMDANRRWPDLLARRLLDAPGSSPAARLGIVNRGIGGNRLLRDPAVQPIFGRAALDRFERDVLGTAGVRAVFLAIGINDIGHPGMQGVPADQLPTPEELVDGYRELIERAHRRGIAVIGVTMTPFEGTVYPGYATPEKERIRHVVNGWISLAGKFDGVIDADEAVRDPAHPTRLLPAYDSGDHLHPNDRGMQAIAAAVPLALVREAALGYRGKAGHRASR
jgi:lysophospholipase L1-like esterase